MKPILGAFGVGAATGLVVGGWPGVAVGLVVALAVGTMLRRLPSKTQRADRRRFQADLPLAADLLASALRAGAAPGHAAGLVGAALGGPVGERLTRAGRALGLGETPEGAWAYLSDVPGADSLVRVAIRSADSGAAMAGAFSRLAGELRAARVSGAEAAARRAGVLVVLPLGLCFLPAFLLAGIVPVVIAVLSGVLG